MRRHRGKTIHGFTIVELLIVIVIIAILAAITIVAYNGIAAKANTASAQAAAKQAYKKVLAYMVQNADQVPPDLATAGVTNQNGTSYQYSFVSSTNPQTFCLTATTANVSYYIDNGSHSTPTAGACAGQAPNGGTVVTNWAANPSGATNATYWSTNALNSSTSLDTSTQRPGSSTTGSIVGTTTVAQAFNVQLWNGSAAAPPLVAVSPGQTWTISAYVKCSESTQAFAQMRWRDSSNTNIANSSGSVVSISSTGWTRISATATAPANAAFLHVSFNLSASVSAGAKYWVDDAMVTQGSTLYSYADGSSPGWIWNGTPGDSTSTGPAL